MLHRIEHDERPAVALAGTVGSQSSEPIVPAVEQGDFDATLLPRDHPRWVKDALTVSSRAKAMIATLRPVAVRILGFWDHRMRSAVIAGLHVGIDASGSYRVQ